MQQSTVVGMIQSGQRVQCILYGGTRGIVSEIHGEQTPETCRSIAAGCGVAGGSAYLDIIWDNGTESRSIPESLVRNSVQWKLLAEVVSQEEIAGLKAHLAVETARRQAEKEAQQKTFLETCETLKGQYPYLKLASEEPNGFKRALGNMRILLKKTYPKVKFSIRQNSYGSATLRWTDGPTAKQVDRLVGPFSGGHFDGMEDIYRHEDTPWNTVFGDAKYITTSRTESDAVVGLAIETLWQVLPNVRNLTKPQPQTVFSGWGERVPDLDVSVAELVRTLCAYYDALSEQYQTPEGCYGRLTFVVDYACAAQTAKAVPQGEVK